VALMRADGPEMRMHGCWSLSRPWVKYDRTETSTNDNGAVPLESRTAPLGMPETGGRRVELTSTDPGTARNRYWGGPEVSVTDVDCCAPEESTYPMVTLSPG
jgi:hypothetical protein